MTEPEPPRGRLDGLKVIAAYLRLDERQVRRLAARRVPADRRLPTFRLSPTDARNARVYAYAAELDAWERAQAARGRRPRTSK